MYLSPPQFMQFISVIKTIKKKRYVTIIKKKTLLQVFWSILAEIYTYLNKH
jgi:hypothetical protein